MKRILIIFLFTVLYSSIYAQVSQKEAYDIVKKEVLKGDTTDIHLYVSKNI